MTDYAHVPAGTVFASDFRIERLLARGGMGPCSSGAYLLSGGQPKRAFEKRVRLVLSAKGGALPLTPP